MASFESIINRPESKKILYSHPPKVKGGVVCDGNLKEVDTKNITCPICGHTMELSEVQMCTERGEDWSEPVYSWVEDLGSSFGYSHKETMVRSRMYHQDNYPAKLKCRHCNSELTITLSKISMEGESLESYYTRKPYGE